MTDFDVEKKKLEILKLQNENIKLQKEAEKLDEEKSKVQAERDDILKPWYRKSAWWTVITTFSIGLGGFYVALQTNIFGIQELKVKNEKLKDSIVINQKQLGLYQDSLRGSKLEYANIKASLERKLTYAEQDKLIKVNNLRRQLIDQQIETYERLKPSKDLFKPIERKTNSQHRLAAMLADETQHQLLFAYQLLFQRDRTLLSYKTINELLYI